MDFLRMRWKCYKEISFTFFVVIQLTIQATCITYAVLENYSPNGSGGKIFRNEITSDICIHIMKKATEATMLIIFNKEGGGPEKPRNITQMRLIIMKESTQTPHLPGALEIHIPEEYFTSLKEEIRIEEFLGSLYQAVVVLWLPHGTKTPDNLILGIAGFMRIQAEYQSTKWKRYGEGDKWDEGDDVTAWFLTYCNELNSTFVPRLSNRIKDSYTPQVWKELLGKSVDELWTDYKDSQP